MLWQRLVIIMSSNFRYDLCREMLTPFTDVLSLLGVITSEMNQFRRQWSMIKTMIYEMSTFSHNKQLACGWFIGNDLNERINHIISIITALTKRSISIGKNGNDCHHRYHKNLLIQNTSNIPVEELWLGKKRD